MKNRLSILLFFSLGWANANAQLNESDTVKFQLRTSLTGNYQQGNVNILTIRGRLDFTFAPVKDFVFKSQNSSMYQEFSDVKADNDIYSRNYFYYKPQRKLYPFSIAYASTNYRRKINSRLFAGAGVTFQVLNKTNHVIKLSTSIVYETNNFTGNLYNYTAYDGSNKINLWRGTLYLAGWNYLLEKHLRFYYDAYWQPAFNNKNNYRTQFDIGFDFPVWKGLALNVLYTFTHENVTIAAVKQNDKIFTFGVGYNFKARR
jgi:Protein of unknown function, DUF481